MPTPISSNPLSNLLQPQTASSEAPRKASDRKKKDAGENGSTDSVSIQNAAKKLLTQDREYRITGDSSPRGTTVGRDAGEAVSDVDMAAAIADIARTGILGDTEAALQSQAFTLNPSTALELLR